MRARALRGSGFCALILASCFHGNGPPSVAPVATLAPVRDEDLVRTEAPFAVVFSGPHGEVTSKIESVVTVLFNRPMRSLEAPDDASSVGASVAQKGGKTVAGKWRWVGTRGLIFEPDLAFPASSEIDVKVPAGVRALDGAALGTAHAFSFSTSRPTVKTASFSGRRDLEPKSVLRIELDQPIDPAEVLRVAKLTVRAKPSDPPRVVPLEARRPSAGVTKPTHWVELVPKEPLPLDHALELVLGKGMKGLEGPLATTAPTTFEMRTYGPLRMTDVRCPKVGMGRCQAGQRIGVVLSNPVAPHDLLAHLAVTPDATLPKNLIAKAPNAPRREHDVIVTPKAGKRYKVTLKAGLSDVFGQKLAKDFSFDVDIEAPFVGGVKGAAPPPPSDDDTPIAAKAPPPSAAPHRPKLAYEAQIGVLGHVVEALAKDGIKSHKIPIGVVNVPTVGIAQTALAETELLEWLARPEPPGGSWAWDWFTPGVPENVRAVKVVDLDALLGKPRGAALLALNVPGGYGAPTQTSLLTVTDLAVSARMSKIGGVVWVTRLSSGAPVPAATVRLVRLTPKKGQAAEAFVGPTDAHGLVEIPKEKYDALDPKEGPAVVVVKSGEDWTFQRVQRSSASTYAWWEMETSNKAGYRGLLFTDRGVYRPGETIKISGVVRRTVAAGLEPPVGKEVKLRVHDGQGNDVAEARAKIDAFGTFAMDVSIPKTAKLGTADVVATLGDLSTSSSVLLAAYKPSAFKIAVDPEKKAYVRGDLAAVAVSGEYLYGAPMDGATVRLVPYRVPISFAPPNNEGIAFGEEGAHVPYSPQDLPTQEGVLDGKGRFEHVAKLAMSGQLGPERVTFEAEVQDATKQSVARSASVLVHPAEFYVGIQRTSRFLAAKGGALDIRPEVVAVEPSGARRAGVPVTVELVARRWVGVVGEQNDGSSFSATKPKDEVIATCTTTTTAKTASCSLVTKDPGFYFVRAVAKDPRGNETRASTSLYVVGDDVKKPQGWAKTDLKVAKLEAEKPLYKVGEKARILVNNPFKSAQALVTVERGGVLHREVVALSGSMPVIEIAVKSEWFPNVFISVDIVRGRVQAPPAKGLDLGGPEFRMGTTEIKIDPESHRLKLAITPSRTELSPGDTFDADVAVTNAEGKPTKASITFYAVDEGVLMLTGYRTPDPLPPFTERQKLGVFGFDSREHLARIVPMKAGEKVPILGWEYEYDGWNKGGEYGDGEGGGGSRPRADFRATAFFEAGRVTGEDGKTRFKVKLPDNLTSYRLMAVAASGDDRFGFGEAAITASKRLMLRPALPRIVRVGDRFDATFVVTSKGLAETDVDVSLSTKGLAVDGPATVRVHVKPNAQVPVRFKVRATQPGPSTLDAKVAGGGASDRVLLERNVDLPLAMKSVAAYGETKESMALALGDLAGIHPDKGGLTAKMSSTALVGLDSSFERLTDYPYGCTEQVASRTLPLLVLRELAKESGARLPPKIDDVVADAVSKLVSHQMPNGGFGFWDDDVAVPWLSAWATLVLEEAHRRGHPVPKDARANAVAYLKSQLQLPSELFATEEPKNDDGDAAEDEAPWTPPSALAIEDRRGIAFASAAFIVDTLAVAGQPDPGTMNRLYDVRAGKPLFAQALLLHAMAKAKLPQAQLEVFAKEIEARLRIGPNEAKAAPAGPVYAPLLDSETRATALVLRAFMAVNPKHPLGSRLARGVLAGRVDGAFRSTQENVWALLALEAYRRAQEPIAPKLEAKAFLGQDEIAKALFDGASFREEKIVIPASKLKQGAPVTFQLDGQGKLFWAVELRYASTLLPTKPLDRGFFIEKRVRSVPPDGLVKALAGLPKSTATKVKAGELVLVDLLLESAEPRDQVLIDDPLAAGLEPIDVNLETVASSQKIGEGSFLAHGAVGSPNAPFLSASIHREHRDDRVLTFVSHLSPGLYHFRYLARATSSGTFVVPPTRVEAMYEPEISGRTAATFLEVVR